MIWKYLAQRVSQTRVFLVNLSFILLISLFVLVELVNTVRDYQFWSSSYGNAYETMADMVVAARYLDNEVKFEEQDVLISSDYYHHPVVAHLAPKSYSKARWFDSNKVLVFSGSQEKEIVYIIPAIGNLEKIGNYFPENSISERFFHSTGWEQTRIYKFDPENMDNVIQSISANFYKVKQNFADVVELIGYKVDLGTDNNSTAKVKLLWRVLEDPCDADYVIVIQLMGTSIQVDSANFPAHQWKKGDVFIGEYDLNIPYSINSGKYPIMVTIFDEKENERLKIKDDITGRNIYYIMSLDLKGLDVEHKDSPDVFMGMRLGSEIELTGYSIPQGYQIQVPSTLNVNLYWKSFAKINRDYTVFLQLLNESGQLIAQADNQPGKGRFPTPLWDSGELIFDSQELILGEVIPEGKFTLIAGMYELSSMERLNFSDGNDYFVLSQIEIVK